MPDETHTPCPACQGRLYPKLLRCADCGIEVTTRYATNEFSDLEAEDLHLLRIFVLCEGRIRDMESALGVSYPTVKSRLAALRTRLGLASDASKNRPEQPRPKEERPEPASARDILDRLASGGLTYDEALARIRALRGNT